MLTVLVSLCVGAPAIAQTSAPVQAAASLEDVRARMDDLKRSITDLQSTNGQIANFTGELDRARNDQGLVAARQTTLIHTGEILKTNIHAIANDRKAYEDEVAQHDAQCPRTSTDSALVASCGAWWARLEITRKDILARMTSWTGRKDKLFAAMRAWDAATAGADKRVKDLQYSLDHLNQAKDRILGHLGQVNQATLDCRKAISSGTEEDMVERCGQLWDGNALHPALINKGTGTRLLSR